MPKTNKSILKRMRLTKTGKVMHSGSGINHFQAKKARTWQLAQKRQRGFAGEQTKNLKAYLRH